METWANMRLKKSLSHLRPLDETGMAACSSEE